ncbi:MAG: tyrosine-type recombinase/integrase [bacterium]|nr:tyrosine-type recombinase/integrase [bacterium]
MANKSDLTSLAQTREPFVEYLRTQKRSISTILAYGKDVSQMMEHLEKKGVSDIGGVKSEHLEDFKSHLVQENYTLKSISRKLNSIKTFFRYIKSQGIVTADPAATVSHPTYEVKPPRILSKMEYRALRDACREDTRIAAIVELMLQTGIRIGEIARIELDEARDEELYIKPNQSQPARTIPLNKAAKNALDAYLKERASAKTKVIFVTKTGRSFLARNIRAAINRYFRIAGIENASVNDLRNTWLAHHLAAGTNPVFLAKAAGHKRLATTEKYLQYIKEATKEKSGEKEKNRLEEL